MNMFKLFLSFYFNVVFANNNIYNKLSQLSIKAKHVFKLMLKLFRSNYHTFL